MEAGLSDELLNLESNIEKYDSLDDGALRKKFASSLAEQIRATNLDRDLKLVPGADGLFSEEAIARVSKHLHDLGNEMIPASMHILGEPPAESLRIPYLVHAMGKRYVKASKVLFPQASRDDDPLLKAKGEEILGLMLKQGLTAQEAVKVAGGIIPGEGLLEAVTDSLTMAVEMNANLNKAGQEIDNVLAALKGTLCSAGAFGKPGTQPRRAADGTKHVRVEPGGTALPRQLGVGVEID